MTDQPQPAQEQERTAGESYTPEQIAAARAAVNAKPADAVLIATERDEHDGSGHRIPRGQMAWRSYGTARYDGPPDTASATHRSVHWTCQACGQRKGWTDQPQPAQRVERVCTCGRKDFCTQDCGTALELTKMIHALRADLEQCRRENDRLGVSIYWAEPNYSEDGRCSECGNPSEDHAWGRDCLRFYRSETRRLRAVAQAASVVADDEFYNAGHLQALRRAVAALNPEPGSAHGEQEHINPPLAKESNTERSNQ